MRAFHFTRALQAVVATLLVLVACSRPSTQGETDGGSLPRPVCGNSKIESGEQCDDGNLTDGDGCERDCHSTQENVVTCQALQPLATGTCTVTDGDRGRVLIGTVLTPTTIFHGGQVVVDDIGRIVQVGCAADCEKDANCKAKAGSATIITCPTGVISPGLINTHDHITYAQNSPYTDKGERYEHRHDWREGSNGHTKISSRGGASEDEVSWGELRFLFGGATSTAGSGGQAGLVRNLDRGNLEEGLGQRAVNYETFPLGDNDGEQLTNSCDYPKIYTEMSIANDDAFFPHIAEGIASSAANEFICVSEQNPGHNLVLDKSAFIHGVGLTAMDYAQMAQVGTTLIWSPRSNITLYGDTAIVTEASRFGVNIALGTDWIPTGSMNMLRELQCADSFNQKYLNKYFTDRDLWMMVTANAAEAAAMDDVIGVLAAGKVADIAVFDARARFDYRAVIDAEPKDVALVLRAGKVLYGDQTIVSEVPNVGNCDNFDLCGVSKQVCLQTEVGKSLETLKTSVGNLYPVFFCGQPQNEPSCTPTRPKSVAGSTIYTGAVSATDSDGDGIPDTQDNCAAVFNPIRPMDKGAQADFDADDVGDACDPCPLDANSASCSMLDPNDRDRDGVPDTMDNCPKLANGEQTDADNDQKGDACDECPNDSNPGLNACPSTIYAIKQGQVAETALVSLTNQLVTARNNSGFFLQVKPGDVDFNGSEYSGIYVASEGNTVLPGDRVTLSSAMVAQSVDGYYLMSPVVKIVTSMSETLPAPVVASPSELATGGAKANALESVIVQVLNVDVTSITPQLGAGDTAPSNEFVVGGSLRVDDFLYLITPFPQLGVNYGSLTGILVKRNGDSKLELRRPSDVVSGQASLVGFGPAQSFIDVGQSGSPSYPTALTVTLADAAPVDTFIPITSSDPNSVTVVGGGVVVQTGQSSAAVLLNGLQASNGVTLSATLRTTTLSASVSVLDATAQPSLISFTPGSPVTTPGGTLTFTVTLDIPAPTGGTTVSLALLPANAGTVPATVMIPAQQLSATFDYVDGGTASNVTINATLGSTTLGANITVSAATGGLVINEIDYDNIGTDNAEFVELFNGGALPVDLSNYSLIFVNGVDTKPYKTVSLASAGTIASGQYLVVAPNSLLTNVPSSVLKVSFGSSTDYIQNGSPDGVALVNTASSQLIDALSYEGAMTSVTLAGFPGSLSLVEGTALSATVADSNTMAGSLCRLPNGTDTDNASSDWKLSGTPTPGAANIP